MVKVVILRENSCHFVKQDLKGQIKSEWIYEIINFSQNDPKN